MTDITFSLSNKTPYKIMVTSRLKSTEKLDFKLNPFDRETNWFEQSEQTYIEIVSIGAEKRIEKLEAALRRMLIEFDFLIESGHLPDIRRDIIFDDARVALGEIKND